MERKMGKRKRHKKTIVKSKIINIFRLIFIFLYLACTLALPVYALITSYYSKESFFYAIIITYASLIFMDIFCTFLEEKVRKIYNWQIKQAAKKQKEKEELKQKKEEEMKELENLLSNSKSYEKEIKQANESIEQFKEQMQNEENTMPKKVKEQVLQICTKMEDIIENLKNDTQQYYPIRHTFQVYFPEFQKMTYLFFNISKINSLDEESKKEYQNMLTEFEKYIDYIKGGMNKTDKLNLRIGITSLVKIIEAERKKGEENAKNAEK